MAIDRGFIGYRLPAFTVTVDPERLRRFAEAIGDGEPGAQSGVAPPTYMKVVEGEGNSSRAILSALGVDLRRVMHVEQEFEYGAPIRGGDALTVERTVSDIHDAKGGALEFIVVDSSMHRPDGTLVGRSRQWIVVRNTVRPQPA
jgi:hydroxyacyl-ACP dehydratase HTD2-like protein with hotdog domain